MLIHGGDAAGFLAEFGQLPLDFSANVSPLGLPNGVERAAIEALNVADQYPYPLCRELRIAIADKEKCYVNQIFCGNGAADVIFRLALALKPKKALLPAPTFAEYGLALAQVGCEIVHVPLKAEENFAITAEFVEKIDSSVDILFICQPNNPTGTVCEKSLLLRILERCQQTGTLLVVDACFMEFLDNFEDFSLESHLNSGNLLILKAFTKLYAMAGLRLGYCLSNDEALLEKMAHAGQPWGVSCVAQKAGIQALKERDYVNLLLDFLRTEKVFLATKLDELGCRVFPPSANFICFQSVVELDKRLKEKGILIRSCANFMGMEPGYFRVAVRQRKDNVRLLEAMKEVLLWENL